jgi:hypothetical protein
VLEGAYWSVRKNLTVFGHVELGSLGDTMSAASGRHAGTPNSYMQWATVVVTDSCVRLGAQASYVHDLSR